MPDDSVVAMRVHFIFGLRKVIVAANRAETTIIRNISDLEIAAAHWIGFIRFHIDFPVSRGITLNQRDGHCQSQGHFPDLFHRLPPSL